MKKRNYFVLIVMFVPVLLIYSASYNDILSSAKNNSYSFQNSKLSYQNSLISINAMDREDEPVWTVSGTITPYSEASENKDLTTSQLEASLTLPNDGGTTIKLASPFTVGYEDGYFAISPSVSASHSFNLNPYDSDYLSDLRSSKNHLDAELSFSKSELSFENQVLSLMKTILTQEKSIKSTEKQIADARKRVEDNLSLGVITADSYPYKEAMLNIQMLENNLDTQKKSYETSLSDYRNMTGLEWDGVTDLPEPSLVFEVSENGNSSIISSSLNLQIAERAVEEQDKKMNPSAIELSGSLAFDVNNHARKQTINIPGGVIQEKDVLDTVAGKLTLGYTGNSWRVNGTFSGGMDLSSNPTFVPAITISGTWSSNLTKNTEQDKLDSLKNDSLKASNDYQNAVIEYQKELFNLRNEVSLYSSEVDYNKNNREYLEAKLALEQQSYEMGLSSQQDVDDAKFELELSRYDDIMLQLDGLILENNIRSFTL